MEQSCKAKNDKMPNFQIILLMNSFGTCIFILHPSAFLKSILKMFENLVPVYFLRCSRVDLLPYPSLLSLMGLELDFIYV